MGKFELKVLKFSISCSPKRGRINILPINAPNIILGIIDPLDPDNTKNQVILILKYYLYKCRCLGDKPSINGGLK
jgi:hypothetical protein